MKRIIFIICFILCLGCSNPGYKGIVVNKQIDKNIKIIQIYNPVIKVMMSQPIMDTDYIIIVKDSLDNEKSYIVNKNEYNEINIGDKFIH